ncbi:MAG TPA: hypothetical protein VNH17_09470, partial [Streptosporangiaceae bacterium]|nr:hypothetical protein [Streptosporangiaceae bacterium]
MSAHPSVGRIVHYVSYGTPGGEYSRECRAAIITEVTSHPTLPETVSLNVGLCVFNPKGMFFNTAPYDDGKPDNAGG